MKPYFLQSMALGARIIQPKGFEADKITQKTVIWSDGHKEEKKQRVGEWFASLEEAKTARIKMLELNQLTAKRFIEKIEGLKVAAEQDYLEIEKGKTMTCKDCGIEFDEDNSEGSDYEQCQDCYDDEALNEWQNDGWERYHQMNREK